MTDFENMTDAELRQAKSGLQHEMADARTAMRAAQVVLEAKRAASDAKWGRAVALATRLVADRFSDEHTQVAERLFAGSDEELAAAEAATSAAVADILGTGSSTSIAGVSASAVVGGN